MTTYLLTFSVLIAGFVFMALALHFSGYKKDGRCCTDGIEFIGEQQDNCDTCPNRETESCQLNTLTSLTEAQVSKL